jgi:transketolase
MTQAKQFIVFAVTTSEKEPIVVCTSRQYTKELAETEVYTKISGKYDIKRTYTQEITIDEDGVVRMVDSTGEPMPMNTFRFS